MTDPSPIDVPQRGFELITPQDTQTRLVTRNANFCTIFVGVNESTGVAFMCHLDWPSTADALEKLVTLIRKEHGSFEGFKLYAASLLPPVPRVLLCVLLPGGIAYWIAGPAFAAVTLVVSAWISLWVQLKCYWIAHKHFKTKIRWLWPSGRPKNIDPKMGIAFDVAVPKDVHATWDEKSLDIAPWKPKSCSLKTFRVRDIAK